MLILVLIAILHYDRTTLAVVIAWFTITTENRVPNVLNNPKVVFEIFIVLLAPHLTIAILYYRYICFHLCLCMYKMSTAISNKQ